MLRFVLLPLLLVLPVQFENSTLFVLEVLFDGVPVQEGGWVVTVTLEAEVDLKEVEIRITTTEGVRINAGEPLWQGDLNAGNEEVLELALTLVGPMPQKVWVDVKGRSINGKAFKKRVERNMPLKRVN